MIFRGGIVVDGTGAPGRRADVLVRGDRIIDVVDGAQYRGSDVRDVTGLVVAPGFVDIHSHSDLSILGHPEGTSAVLQGVTTEVVGNCGLSVVPVSTTEVGRAVRRSLTFCDDESVVWDWTDVSSYKARLALAGTAPSVEVLAGHIALRASVVGFDDRPATGAEITRMAAMLDDALDQGALGLSLGLMYPPSAYATELELVALGRVLARHDALLACHMEDYGSGLIPAVEAMIRVGEQSGCRVQISHLTAVGRENWGSVTGALELIDRANENGSDIAVDFYPYLAGSTNLSQLLPGWVHSGGMDAMRERLRSSTGRERVRAHLAGTVWEDVLLVATGCAPELDGLRVSQAARLRNVDPDVLTLELLARTDPTIIAFGRSEGDLRSVMRHPRSVLGSDGMAVAIDGVVGGGVPHPRYFGAFPALFERYVRGERVLTLEEAVRKCSAAPAERIRLRDRGVLAPGMRADIVVFDPERIADRATYEDSRHAPDGVMSVIRSGVEVARDGKVMT